MPAAPPSQPMFGDAALVRGIGFWGATAIGIDNVPGAAVFLASGPIIASLRSTTAFLGAWVAGGVITLAGCVTVAAPGAMFPRSGGLSLFVLGSGPVVANSPVERPVESLIGLALVGAGLPCYWFWARTAHRAVEAEAT